MDVGGYFSSEFAEHASVLAETERAVRQPFLRLVEACVKAARRGGKILFLGNGGSAADAQHLATELTIRFIKDRAPIAAIALTTDTSTLTAAGNDMGFDNVFSRQIEALARPGDVVIAISTSGNSENIVRALKAATAAGAVAAGLSGKGGGRMVGLADPLVVVPSTTTARIQEMHITLGHLLCGAVEQELGLA